mgnify:CR=1 FL=1
MMLVVQNLHAGYDAFKVLRGIDFTVAKGQWVSIIGTNGAGKTTLMNTLTGILPATEGSVFFQGIDTTHYKPFQLSKLGISYMAEGRQIFNPMTVKDNLELGGIAIGLSRLQIQRKLQEIYQQFPSLHRRLYQKAGTLSGGEQQLLALGRCLMSSPSFLLCDEPTLGLSPIAVSNFFQILQNLHRQGIAVLMVEQNIELALRFCDQAYVMNRGQITLSGTGQDLLNDPQVKQIYLGVL